MNIRRTAGLCILLIVIAVVPLAAVEVRGNQQGTWTRADGPYIVTGDITVPAGQVLTIEAGTEVRFRDNTGVDVRGTLNVQGTSAAKVLFTSDSSNEPGNWKGIIFQSGSSGTIDHARVLYTGARHYVAGGWRNTAVAVLGDASPVISNSEISWSSGDAFLLAEKAQPSITNNAIANLVWPVRIVSWSAMPQTMSGNRFSNIGRFGVRLDAPNLPNGETMEWKVLNGLPYSTGNVLVGIDSTLTIEAGNIVKFNEGTQLEVRGTLTAQGEPAAAVVLTSAFDDLGGDTNGDGDETAPKAGNWRGLIFQDGSSGTLEYAQVLYTGERHYIAGGWKNTAVAALGNASPVIRNSEISWCSGDAVFAHGSAAPAAGPHVLFMDIEGHAVRNMGSSVVQAERSWWGDSSGPKHSGNPEGTGYAVSDNVNYTPFLEQAPELWRETVELPDDPSLRTVLELIAYLRTDPELDPDLLQALCQLKVLLQSLDCR